MISRLCVSGYRSLRDVRLTLDRLTVVTGPNGSGKSSLYRALRLLADVAQGRVVQSLAAEGGIQSTLWAGPETFAASVRRGDHPVQGQFKRKNPIAVKLGFAGEHYGFAIDLGYPVPAAPANHVPSLFHFDPEIKAEAIWTGEKLGRASAIALRAGPSVRVRDADGAWRQAFTRLAPIDSMMTHCADPKDALELLVTRERMKDWRFYDHLRTDRDAPARRPQIGTHTPVLASDGGDLAAAIQTIREIGDIEAFDETIADAFPGGAVSVSSKAGLFDLDMAQHGLLRRLGASELSDGTLRYLLLSAALLSPRPPELMVLNEPETSLHPDLLPALGRLIARAAERSQVLVVSHAQALVLALEEAGAKRVMLEKTLGETLVDGDDRPSWEWPSR